MADKQQPILNKYDIHNVESRFNDFLTETVVQELKCSKVVAHEYFKLAFGVVYSAVILLSYFHKTPFPQDKPQIALCVVLYAIMNLIMSAYKKYKLQGAFNDFILDPVSLPKLYESFKQKNSDQSLLLKLKSEVKEFTNIYTVKASMGDRNSSETIAYNEYIDDEGYVNEAKMKALLSKLLKAL